ncbi:MAG: prolyl-tRNA synthetase associated domain-containing protein [Patescibacteria group bacterium]
MVDVEKYLQSHDIKYAPHKHPAVFTCDEAEKHCADVPGIPGKNLFLKNKGGKRYFLVVLPASKRADLKKIAKIVGESKVSFANSEALKEKLDLEPGSVSPFGLLNDVQHEVEVYIDKDIYDANIVNFHPKRNTASLELTGEMFRKYLKTIENKVQII